MHYKELKAAWAELTAPGAPFETHDIDIRGYSARAYRHAPANIRDFWLSTAAFADRDYLIYQDERLSYAEAHDRVRAIAAWLWSQGVRPGDRVAIAMRNYPEWLLIYWASACIGVAAVGMNAWWVAEEMEYALKDSRPKVLFCDAERWARIATKPDALEGVKVVSVRMPTPAGAVPIETVFATPGPLPEVHPDPDDDACIFYTSGTTGFPKGAQLTHRGCISNLFNMVFSSQVTAAATARGTGVAPPVDPLIPRGLITTPLFHVTANNCGAYLVTAAGGALVLMYRWDAEEALKLIEREKITNMSGVPVMSRELITHPDFDKYDLSSLISLGGGGAQLQPDLVAKIEGSLTAVRPQTGYGMTETCGIITAVSGDFFVDRPASAGPAMPTFECKCVDDEGNTVPPGGVGELWVKGACVIKGYINRPEATAESITQGWLHTGDIARIDEDGFIFIVDRKKDMVLRGGENVFCAEVEAAIHHDPAVAEVCVFGVPDQRLGEEVAAAVVLRPGAALSAEDLRGHLSQHVAKHKIPRYIWFREEPIPRNASGKFLKKDLRKSLDLKTAQ